MVVGMLTAAGVQSKSVVVIDNNDIDREVTQYKPTTVVIEALWVVPEKFIVLANLHPSVQWIIRLHSNTPFLVSEGIAFPWIAEYLKQPKVYVAANNTRLLNDLTVVFAKWRAKLLYMPNYYQMENVKGVKTKAPTIRIACMGAIRPMKNQVIQAIAAIDFANELSRKLQFFVNATRVEMNGAPVLKNLRALFALTAHELVEVPWLDHTDFITFLKKNIDIGMQVSFTETFNIVTADCVSQDVAVLVSKEVEYIPRVFTAYPADAKKITRGLWRTYRLAWLRGINMIGLAASNASVRKAWLKVVKA
jgi:hypothetical protein